MEEEQQLEVLYGMVQKSLKDLEATRAQLAQQTKANASSVKAIEAMAPRLERAVSQTTVSAMQVEFEALALGLAQRVTNAGQQAADAGHQTANALAASG